jgi:hypothetical protein
MDWMGRLDWKGDSVSAGLWVATEETGAFRGAFENFLRVLTAHALLLEGGVLLHSAAVVSAGGAYLFVGPSGAGKSTISHASHSAGRTVVSDDLNVVTSRFTLGGNSFFSEIGTRREGSFPLRGMYRLYASSKADAKNKVHLFGSGAILNEVIRAQRILEDAYDIPVDVYSVTSYKQLYTDAIECERFNLLHPGETERVSYVAQVLQGTRGVYVAASDYMKALPASIARWMPTPFDFLGTDGFGRSSNRAGLRDFFEVDARYIVLAALRSLAREGHVKKSVVKEAIQDFGIDPNKQNPHRD